MNPAPGEAYIAASPAGDINGDGFDDIVLSDFSADPDGILGAGQTGIVFGSNGGFPTSRTLIATIGTIKRFKVGTDQIALPSDDFDLDAISFAKGTPWRLITTPTPSFAGAIFLCRPRCGRPGGQ